MAAWLAAAAVALGAVQGGSPALTLATPRGESRVPLVADRAAPAVAWMHLVRTLPLAVARDSGRIVAVLAGRTFVFQLGTPYVRAGDSVYGLVDPPYVVRDTLFLPLQWLAEVVPRVLPRRFRYQADQVRLEELPVSITAAPPPVSTAPASPAAARYGLRWRHVVTVDPGHGGVDPGNPGQYFPSGVREKDITLAVARELAAELDRRGIGAILTRARDTLIALRDRAVFCRADCDLFVSIHVNAMPAGRRRNQVRGLETYFLAEARTEDARRVAEMENEAVRFETSAPAAPDDPLRFMINDLQLAEHLRESARLAELVHGEVVVVHPGGDRGVQQAGFLVLTTARRPAILIETGFATNRDDARFLGERANQRRVAAAIADGIVAYLLEYERRLGGGRPTGSGR